MDLFWIRGGFKIWCDSLIAAKRLYSYVGENLRPAGPTGPAGRPDPPPGPQSAVFLQSGRPRWPARPLRRPAWPDTPLGSPDAAFLQSGHPWCAQMLCFYNRAAPPDAEVPCFYNRAAPMGAQLLCFFTRGPPPEAVLPSGYFPGAQVQCFASWPLRAHFFRGSTPDGRVLCPAAGDRKMMSD